MNQSNRFRCEMRPKAHPQNLVSGKTCRFTVLDSRLIRMEYAPDGVFEDRASQMAFFRDFAPCEFTWEMKDGVVTVKTEHLVLTCKDHLVHYYAKFGFVSEGVSGSTHGGVVWYQMRLTF